MYVGCACVYRLATTVVGEGGAGDWVMATGCVWASVVIHCSQHWLSFCHSHYELDTREVPHSLNCTVTHVPTDTHW